MADPVIVERREAVATVTLNRPEVLNALDEPLAVAFRDAMLALEADRAVRAVVIRGAGRGFMAGGDVATFHRALDGDIAGLITRLIDVYHVAVRAIARMPKPVIASLHGPVAGAGLSLALNTDLAIAADDTVFALAYSAIGASPDGGATYFLPRILGRRRTMALAMLGDRIGAADALAAGLVNRVVPADRLAEETEALAARLAAGPTQAFARTKALVHGSLENDFSTQLDLEREAFGSLAPTRDFAEGVRAFVGKRKAAFRGE